MTLEGKNASLRLESGFALEAFDDAPDVAYMIRYEYSSADAPIGSVTVRLSDYSREIAVGGTSRNHVDALLGVIASDLRQHRVFLGGTMFRAILQSLLWGIGALLVAIPALASLMHEKLNSAISLSVTGVLFQLLAWLIPRESWFPGTAIYRDSASVMVRRAPLISFLGVIITLITGTVGILLALRHDNPTPPRQRHSVNAVDSLTHR